ncbi:MAG TPA: hypothetical protein DHV36_04900 [Desulfobacteraceae bacterium]|nr:hypothetical protein [Desulfobacteraceae bacterium]
MVSLVLFLLTGFVVTGVGAASDTPWDVPLPFAAGEVSYKISGTLKGEKTIYVKDYGRSTAEYSQTAMTMYGMKQEQKEVVLTTPEWVYTADLVEKTGTRQANMKKFLRQEYQALSPGDKKKMTTNAEKMGISTLEGAGGRVDKKAATILGYPCDKVTLMGTESYTITGTDLPLKIQGDTMGMKMMQEAVAVTVKKVDGDRFELPAGIRFDHNPAVDDIMKHQARNIVQRLVEGKQPDMASGYQMSQGSGAGMQGTGQMPQSTGQGSEDTSLGDMQEKVNSLLKGMFD